MTSIRELEPLTEKPSKVSKLKQEPVEDPAICEDDEFEMIRVMEKAKLTNISDETMVKVVEAIRIIDEVIAKKRDFDSSVHLSETESDSVIDFGRQKEPISPLKKKAYLENLKL